MKPRKADTRLLERSYRRGFTLIEVMVVIAIIAIIATLAIPSQVGVVHQKRVIEVIELLEPYKANIEQYYRLNNGSFPLDNAEAGLPEPRKLIGNYIEKTQVRSGVMHIYLGRKMAENLHNKIVSIRPVYVKDSPASPISWVCGYDQIPSGMVAAGTNMTNLEKIYLPGRCR